MKTPFFSYTSPREIPLSFRLGGKEYRGIGEEFKVSVTENKQGAVTVREITGIHDAGLEIRAEYREYDDFAATEWLVFLTNKGAQDTEILTDLRLGGTIDLQAETLCHSNGDNRAADGYEVFYTPLTEAIHLCPNDGTSCNGAWPYLRLLGQDGGVNVAIGWSSKWCADLAPAKGGTSLSVGQARCHMRIRPGETIRTPRLTLVAYDGSETYGRNVWRRWYFAHILPKKDGESVKPLCCMHYFAEGDMPEFTGATEQGQLTAMDAYTKGGIHPDVWWIDAGWYPCNGQWRTLGNWYADPVRFPHGLAPIGEKCKELGMAFLLWFEPERIVSGTELALAHPEWMLRPAEDDGTYKSRTLLNIGDAACCDYMIETIDRIIKESGVNIYRQDFNMDPAPQWELHEAEDRIGALENLHIQGYYRLWDTLLERNPGLLIDSCASGGRRNDLETMRRSITLHYTDVGYGNHPIKQTQHRLMFEWVPYFRAHTKNWDDLVTKEYTERSDKPVDEYAFYVALTPALTDMLHYADDEKQYALSHKMQPIWRKAAELMLRGDYYPLTPAHATADDFYAMAFYDEAAGEGFLNVVSNNRNEKATFTAVLDMLDADAVYTLTEAETGETATHSGAELQKGFTAALPQRSGKVYFLKKA